MSASHSVAPLSRLLWKEYRTQRSLWLAMLALGIVPQLLLRFAISETTVRANGVWVMVGVLPFLFVIGSTAILFAGEREERTVDWLLNLAVPHQWTLLAKWTFLLLATAALAATLSLSALLLVWSLPEYSNQGSGPGPEVDVFVFRWIVAYVGVAIWGGLGSLISRRVVTAVPAMGFWWLMTLIVPVIWVPALLGLNPAHQSFLRVQNGVVIWSFIAVGVANLVLGLRWCQGKYLDATVLEDANTMFVACLNRLRGRTSTRVRVPTKPEADSPWRREWQRLIWQERYRDRYHLSLLYLGWVISLFLAGLGVAHGVDIMPGIVPMIVVLPLVMGVLGFRYDGEGQPLRFLSNRGVEARFLWLAKHAVWLPRAFWIPLLIWLVAALFQSLLPHPIFTPPVNRLLNGFTLLQAYPGIVLAFVLLSYGCGQLAAILFRRTILAGVVGLTASLLATLWLGLAVGLHVPLWWSVSGLILWIYVLTYWHAPSWLIERSLVGRLKQWGAFVVPPVLLISAWGIWRAYEIPGFSPNILSSGQSFERLQTANIHKQQLDPSYRSLSPTDLQLLDRLALSMGGSNRVQDFIVGSQGGGPAGADSDKLVDPVEAFWHDNESRLKELLDITNYQRGPSASRWLEFAPAGSSMMPQQVLLLEAGRLRTGEGRLDDALNFYCASLRLASFWASNSGFSTRQEAQNQQMQTLDSIVQWASHPDQTAQTLRAARRRIQIEFDLFPSIQQALVAEYHRELVALEQTVQHGAHWVNRPADAWQLLMIDYFRFFPWEKVRANRWLEQQLLDRDQLATKASELLRQPGVDVQRDLEQIRMRKLTVQLVHQEHELWWQWTTPLAAAQYDDSDVAQTLLFEREVMVRESLLALSLLAWRQEHHQWPGTLAEALVGLPAITSIDPWCGALFHYNGPLLNQREQDSQPPLLLSTVGPNQLREVLVDHTLSVGTDLRSWSGTSVVSDDRLRLKVDQGKVFFQLPNSIRLAPSRSPSGD